MVVRDKSMNIEILEFTPAEKIEQTIATVRESFFDSKTRLTDFRKTQLRKLYWAWVLFI
jgi:hypothetical protein